MSQTLADLMTKIQALPGFMEVVEVTYPIVGGKMRYFEVYIKDSAKMVHVENVSIYVASDNAAYYTADCILATKKKPIPDQIKAAMDALLVGASKVRMIFYDPDTALGYVERCTYDSKSGVLSCENYKIFLDDNENAVTAR